MDEHRVEPGRASISKGASAREIGEYWDNHDFTDYEDKCPDVSDQFEVDIRAVHHLVAVDPDLLQEAITSASKRGIAVQTLVNLALRDTLRRSGDD